MPVGGTRSWERPTNDLMTAKVAIIGATPGASGKADFPLYPLPPGCVGHRIFEMMGLKNYRSYFSLTFRANLLTYNPGPHWPKRLANVAANAMIPFLENRNVVLVGRKVAAAFSVGDIPYLQWHGHSGHFNVAILPTPAYGSEWYNNGRNLHFAQAFLAEALG